MKYFYFGKDVNIIYFSDFNNSIKDINSKSDLRKTILNFRNSLDKNDVISMSKDISESFLALKEVKFASRFMLYSGFRNEVKTTYIINALLEMDKEVYLPVTIKEDKKLIPKRIFSLNDLKSGAYGILEPKEDAASINPSLLDVVVVPGSVFDINGYRTGYGGGYYDRFLEKTDALRVGIAYSFQVVENTYPEEHDKKMDIIITENNIKR